MTLGVEVATDATPHRCTCPACLNSDTPVVFAAEVAPSPPRPLTRDELLAAADAVRARDAAPVADHDVAEGLLARAAAVAPRHVAKFISSEAPAADLESRLAEIRRAPNQPLLHDAPSEDLELRTAQLDATLDDLAAVVRILIRAGGYMAPEDQVALRAAMARLAEHDRSVEDAPAPAARSTR